MKTVFKIILLVFFFSFQQSYLQSNDSIRFIDFDFLIENTTAGKKIVDDLKKIRQENISILKPKEKSIQDLEASINKKKNIISENELNILITDMKKKISEFRILQNKLMKNLDKKKNDELNKFVQLTVPIIENYMKKKNISIIVDKKNIFIASKDYNISGQLIPLINNQLK